MISLHTISLDYQKSKRYQLGDTVAQPIQVCVSKGKNSNPKKTQKQKQNLSKQDHQTNKAKAALLSTINYSPQYTKECIIQDLKIKSGVELMLIKVSHSQVRVPSTISFL